MRRLDFAADDFAHEPLIGERAIQQRVESVTTNRMNQREVFWRALICCDAISECHLAAAYFSGLPMKQAA